MPIFKRADILLPKTDIEKWAVIACDQHTANPEYWQDAEKKREGSPSSLDLIIPEVYLSDDYEKRVVSASDNMKKYLENDIFELHRDSMIYVERETLSGVRKGLVGIIDLNEYDYNKGSSAKIRATEMTVTERIPPRVKVRRDALLELPHILVLVDDKDFEVIEPCSKEKDSYKKAYSASLMLSGGHIDGYFLSESAMDRVESTLDRLSQRSGFALAIGDGNHSLAAAKECVSEDHPESRFALCEIVNIHEASLVFEPIYRVVFGVDGEKLLSDMERYFGTLSSESGQKALAVYNGAQKELSLPPVKSLTVATLTEFLDAYTKENENVTIDYIHGKEEALRLAEGKNTVAFLFDVIGKSELFKAVEKDGALARKTFSMGEASDKRYYLEARKIK